MIKKFFESTYDNTTIPQLEFRDLLESEFVIDITDKDIQQIQKYFDKFVVKTKITPKYLVKYSKKRDQIGNTLPKSGKILIGIYTVDDWNKDMYRHFPKNFPKIKIIGIKII